MGLLVPLENYSSFRRIALAQWKPSNDPVIHGHMWFDVTESEQYLHRLSQEHGVKITLGSLVGKAVANALGEMPTINGKVLGRRIYLKKSVDVYYQVDVGKGSDLTGMVVEGADKLSLVDIARQLAAKAEKIRAGRDAQYEKTQKRGIFKWSPIWLLDLVLRLLSFCIYNLGLPSKWFGSSQADPFGSVMVTNVGGFGIDVAYAPLVPWSKVPYILLVGKAREKPEVVDGKLTIRKMLPVSATLDHRVIDGARIGELALRIRAVMEAPEKAMEGFAPAAAAPEQQPTEKSPAKEEVTQG